ncbi:MAG: hypothetical protein SGJ23_03230 [Alphaproteobacteria bacterium]|nr:hypothetical protein [Alphaproteobacteria bacterium]
MKDAGRVLHIISVLSECVELSDFPYFVASPLNRWLGLGPIDARRAHTIINVYSRAFFDRYLKDAPTQPLLAGPAPQYPDVHFERRGP